MEASESTGVSSNLTSTVESLLTNNGHEKKISHNDSISVGDSTPSSSSDANMQTSVVKTIQDDPISSTSDALTHEPEINLNTTSTTDVNSIVGVEGTGSTNELGTDSDFFTSELNIESMTSEKISEDVEDIANDLENLLGETTSSYDVICSNSDTITEANEIEKNNTILAAKNVGNLADQDTDSNISVKSEIIHDANVQLVTCHGQNNVGTIEITEEICAKSESSELNNKTDILSKHDNIQIATCINKTEEVEANIKSHESNVEGPGKTIILQNFIENQAINEESKVNSQLEGNLDSASQETISVIEKENLANSQEELQLRPEVMLENMLEKSNNDQRKQLIIKEEVTVQLKENISEGECLQEIIGTESVSEVNEEKVCIMSRSESAGTETKIKTQSDVVFQETTPADELHEISSQPIDSQKVSSSVELKETSPEVETILTEMSENVCKLPVQDEIENTPSITESNKADDPSITSADGNETSGSDIDSVDNKQLNSDGIDLQVSIHTDHKLEHNSRNVDNKTTDGNVDSPKRTSNPMNIDVGNNTIVDTFKLADEGINVIPVGNTCLIVENDAVCKGGSVDEQYVSIDKSNLTKGEFSLQDVPSKNINNKDEHETSESINNTNQSEEKKGDLLQHYVSQNEDIMNNIKIDENSENKEHSQQEVLDKLNNDLEAASELNAGSSLIILSDSTDQPPQQELLDELNRDIENISELNAEISFIIPSADTDQHPQQEVFDKLNHDIETISELDAKTSSIIPSDNTVRRTEPEVDELNHDIENISELNAESSFIIPSANTDQHPQQEVFDKLNHDLETISELDAESSSIIPSDNTDQPPQPEVLSELNHDIENISELNAESSSIIPSDNTDQPPQPEVLSELNHDIENISELNAESSSIIPSDNTDQPPQPEVLSELNHDIENISELNAENSFIISSANTDHHPQQEVFDKLNHNLETVSELNVESSSIIPSDNTVQPAQPDVLDELNYDIENISEVNAKSSFVIPSANIDQHPQKEVFDKLNHDLETISELDGESSSIIPSDNTDQPAQQEVLDELNHDNETLSELNADSSFIISSANIDQPPQQEGLDKLNDDTETISELNAASSSVNPPDNTYQSGDFVNTELKAIASQESQEDQRIEISSDGVTPTDNSEVNKEKYAEEKCVDAKDNQCDNDQLEKINEVSIITEMPSKFVDEDISLVSNINETKIPKDGIEVAVGKSDTLNYVEEKIIVDRTLEFSVNDTVSLTNILNEKDSTLHRDTEPETPMTTSQEDMNINELEICAENERQENVIKVDALPTPIEFSEAKGEHNIESSQSNDQKSLVNLTDKTEVNLENIHKNTEIIENIESDSSNLDKLKESGSLKVLEETVTSKVEGVGEICLQDENMKEHIPEFVQETSQSKLEGIHDDMQSENLDQAQANDMQDIFQDTFQGNLVSEREVGQNDNVAQDQLNDAPEVGNEQQSIKIDQNEGGVVLDSIKPEILAQEILQDNNTRTSELLITQASKAENLEEKRLDDVQPNIELLSADVKQVDVVRTHVEQPLYTTCEKISTEEDICATESNITQSDDDNILSVFAENINEYIDKSQDINKLNEMESQNQSPIEEVLHDADKIDSKTDDIEDNVNEDKMKDLSISQELSLEEHISEEHSMDVIAQVESTHIDSSDSNPKCCKNTYENATNVETVISDVPLDERYVSSEHCSDQNESEEINTEQIASELQTHSVLKIHHLEDSVLDINPSEIVNEISPSIDSHEVLDELNEASELQNAISHIMEASEEVGHSNVSLLHAASMVNAINPLHENDDVKSSELHSVNSDIFYSPDSTDMKTSEVEDAISQIIESSTIGHTLDTTSELQNAISHIIDDAEPMIDCDKTSELQNSITQIIDSAEIQSDSNDQHAHSDILKTEIDYIHSSNQKINIENESEILEQIDPSTQGDVGQKSEDTEEIGEKTILDNDKKQESEEIMQTIYTEPVVDLMLQDMDDQLKMFESKSENSITNIANIGEVYVDTPKTFESQDIGLILPEETSLLNTDDIISEITPRNEDIVEFPHEVDIKLQEEHVSENELKLAEMHTNESKDLNDVIAREIESLLELQTQNLTADVSDECGEDLPVKMENQMADFVLEEKITNVAVLESSEASFESSSIGMMGNIVLQDNVLHQSTQQEIEKSEDNIDLEKTTIKNEEKLGVVIEAEDVGEVSSSSVINTAAFSNLESDSLITSTNCTELQPAKELDTPLLIEVGTSITTVEGKESSSQTQIEVPTSEYSSKMSENQDLKMTITKHKVESSVKVSESLEEDDNNSILKIYDPKDIAEGKKTQKSKDVVVPKLIIKPIVKAQSSPTSTAKHFEEVEQTIPKLFIKNMSPNRPGSPKVVKAQKSEITSPLKLTIKPVLKPEECQSKSSPKLTIKPIIKTDEETSTSGPKITIKPIVKPPEEEMCHSPKITIKPIIKSDDCQSDLVHSPRITIKPIPKPEEVKEFSVLDTQSPRLTIKPVVKPEECDSSEKEIVLKKSSDIENTDRSHSPRITIKPVVKPEEHKSSSKQDQKVKQDDVAKADKKEGSPKITIKPIIKPIDSESESVELIDFEDQIKQERIVLKINKNSMSKDSRKRDSTEDIEKLAKIKLKFSKEGGRAQIVSDQSKLKRALEESLEFDQKRTKFESDDLTITPIDADAKKTEKIVDIIKDDVNITPIEPNPRSIFEDPLEKIPVFEITPESAVMMKSTTGAIVQQVTAPAPRKRGRPRKVPLVVREEFKDAKEEEVPPEQQLQPAPEDTGRPKRSCRGPSVRTTLGIRTRKPRGSGRGRGRGRGARGVGSRGGRQQRVSAAKLKLLQEEAAAAIAEQSKSLELEDGGDIEMKEEPPVEHVATETSEIVLIEEETRMSADINTSRAQTPAKQIPTPGDVDDTQSSVQSTATTESTKGRKGTRIEVHQEPEGEIISADQLTEYYWVGLGPYMLQEQVAQFLGIKSFKRKYPGIQRRMVDMQERDFIRESGLASEAMCDLGLTAVHSADILDIMYSDFQNKYEEYCKHQRDRQAKDLSNKQKALSLAASQEKNKQDIMQTAVQSAASWNANFNKSRREERKACMDLQTFTVHYPKGRFKTIERNKIGHYPVALVPGQYTDYYKTFTSNELSNLPLNTMLDKPLNIPVDDDSQSDGSGSDSDSSTSDSDSSSSDSSDEDCTLCSPTSSNQSKKVLAN